VGGSTTPGAQEGSARAAEAASVAGHQASDLASSAVEQAREVGAEALAQTHSLVEEARQEVWRQGEAQTDRLVGALGQLRDQAEALLDGRPEDAPRLAQQGRAAVGRLDEMTRRLETRGLDGLVDDLGRLARRRPGAFLAAAGTLGFVAGRLVRARRDNGGGNEEPANVDGSPGRVLSRSPAPAPPRVTSPPPPPLPPPVPALDASEQATAAGPPPGMAHRSPATAPPGGPPQPPLPPEYLEGAP
jgi:hypothetical protein